jgi:hypothetical protein
MAIEFTAGSNWAYSRATGLPSYAVGYTICGWYKWRNNTGGYQASFGLSAGAGQGDMGFIFNGSTDWYIQSETGGFNNVRVRFPIAVNSWYYFVMRRSGGTHSGAIIAPGETSVTFVSQTHGPGTAPTRLEICGSAYGMPFYSRIAGLKIYDAVLTDTELLAERDSLAPVRTANLNSYYPFNAVADATTDYGGAGRTLTLEGGATVVDTADMPPVSTGITGSLARTLGALAGTSTGTVETHGAVTSTLGALTGAATATNETHGTLATTLAALTGVAAAVTETHGTLTRTLGPLVSVAAATTETHGTLTRTLDALTCVATIGGLTPITGVLTSTLATLTTTAQASVEIHGVLVRTLGALRSAEPVVPVVVVLDAQGSYMPSLEAQASYAPAVECVGSYGS